VRTSNGAGAGQSLLVPSRNFSQVASKVPVFSMFPPPPSFPVSPATTSQSHGTTLTPCGGQATTIPFGHHKDITLNLRTLSRLVSSRLVSSRLFSSLLVPSHPVLLHLTSTHHVCLWSSSRLEPSCTQHRRGSCMSPRCHNYGQGQFPVSRPNRDHVPFRRIQRLPSTVADAHSVTLQAY
jgi:hypothetical protein